MKYSYKCMIPIVFTAANLIAGCAGTGQSAKSASDEIAECQHWSEIGCHYSFEHIEQMIENAEMNKREHSSDLLSQSKLDMGNASHKQQLIFLTHLKDSINVTPLLAAALRHDADAVRKLIEAGANPCAMVSEDSKESAYELTEHDAAVLMNDLVALKLLVETADIEPILLAQHLVALPGIDLEIAKYVLDKREESRALEDSKAAFSVLRDKDVDLMRDAVTFNNQPLVEEFLKRGFSVDERSVTGNTMLMNAMLANELDMASFLIAKGADVNAENKEGISAWDMMLDHPGRSRMLKVALERDDITMTPEETFALHFMTDSSDTESFHELLIHKGAKIDLCTCDGKSALMLALEYKDTKLLNALLSTGADVNIRATNGKTPLISAVESNEYIFVQKMLEGGARVDECVEVVTNEPIRSDSDSNDQIQLYNDVGVCTLSCLAPQNENDVQNTAKSALPSPKTENNVCQGKTALMLAVEMQNMDFVDALLEGGANPNLTNSDGVSAMSIAIALENQTLIDRLEGKQGDDSAAE